MTETKRFKKSISAMEWTANTSFDIKKSPYASPYTGLWYKPVTTDSGEQRSYYLYTPTNYRLWIPMVMVFCPNGFTGEQFANASVWMDLAEEKGFAVTFASAKDGNKWNTAQYEEECSYISRIMHDLLSNDIINYGNDHLYAVGYGEGGATMGVINSIIHQGQWSGYASVGAATVEPDVIRKLGDTLALIYEEDPTFSLEGYYNKNMLLPVWIINDHAENDALIEYFKCANHTEDTGLFNKYARIFLQKKTCDNKSRNSSALSSVWVSSMEGAAEQFDSGELERFMWDSFFSPVYRAPDLPGGSFHASISFEELGVKEYRFEINGVERRYFVYVPVSYDGTKALPVVIQTHGFAADARQLLYYNEMWDVADKRGFILVMTQATRGHKAAAYPPQWATGLLGNVDTTAQTTIDDEIAYFERIYAEVADNYAVDTGRVFLTGHSNGAAMTSVITDVFGSKITAAAGIGFGCIHAESYEDINRVEKADCITPYYMGSGEFDLASTDIDGYQSVPTDKLNEYFGVNENVWNGMHYWSVRYRLKRNGMDPKSNCFTERDNTVFRLREYYNDKAIPLVYFMTYPKACHSYDVEIAYSVWDNFFCNYSRDKDGVLYYREVKVE